MKEVAKLLEDLKASGVIRDYALFGAVAQMRYTEPVATLDADVLVLLRIAETGCAAQAGCAMGGVQKEIYRCLTSRQC